MSTRGYIVWQGPSPFTGAPIVAILTMHSVNRKTGDMAQLWILRSDVAPNEALATGGDDAICGLCPLRGDGTGKGRACYVTVVQAPLTVWRTYRAGGYAVASLDTIAAALQGRRIRLGAYGDPAMMPLETVRALTAASDGWTGYTHQWRTIPAEWRHYLMASADTVADRRAARLAGWRSFYVVPADTDLASVPHAVECMATRDRNPLQCSDCLACSGTRSDTIPTAVDIVIRAHGTGARYVA